MKLAILLSFYNAIADISVGETWLLGIFTGLVIVYFFLSNLSKIKPYILCNFWFVALIALYTWRSGYVFIAFPKFNNEAYFEIVIFILQSIPLIVFLIIAKVITVLQAKKHYLFSQIFSVLVWLSMSYLGFVIIVSLIDASWVVTHLSTLQVIFWLILGVEGAIFFTWMSLSSKRNYKFLLFQASFAVLFLVSVGVKIYMNISNANSEYIKTTYLLWGMMAQLLFMYWLLLREVFSTFHLEKINIEYGEVSNVVSQSERTEAMIKPTVLRDELTSREKDILLAYCNGFSYTDISSAYFISPNTVKTHLKNCYRKLNINSKVEAIALVNELKEYDLIV